MISWISGQVIAEGVVAAGNVGYQVETPHTLEVGTEVELWCVHTFSERGQRLYGFSGQSGRDLFVRLTEVKGVGGAMALAILGELGAEQAAAAIAAGDVAALESVRGVGKRSAERIVLELEGAVTAAPVASRWGETWEAAAAGLTKLGFPPKQINEVLTALHTEAGDDADNQASAALIRQALGRLGAKAS